MTDKITNIRARLAARTEYLKANVAPEIMDGKVLPQNFMGDAQYRALSDELFHELGEPKPEAEGKPSILIHDKHGNAVHVTAP